MTVLTPCYKSHIDFYSEQWQKDFRKKCKVWNDFMKIFILWLEYYWTWVIKISALLKFHLYNKSLKFLAFICIKIESQFFKLHSKPSLIWLNPYFFSATPSPLWGFLKSPWPLETVYFPLLLSQALASFQNVPVLPFSLKCMPEIRKPSQRLAASLKTSWSSIGNSPSPPHVISHLGHSVQLVLSRILAMSICLTF